MYVVGVTYKLIHILLRWIVMVSVIYKYYMKEHDFVLPITFRNIFKLLIYFSPIYIYISNQTWIWLKLSCIKFVTSTDRMKRQGENWKIWIQIKTYFKMQKFVACKVEYTFCLFLIWLSYTNIQSGILKWWFVSCCPDKCVYGFFSRLNTPYRIHIFFQS